LNEGPCNAGPRAAPTGNTFTSGGYAELRPAGAVKSKLVGLTRFDRWSRGASSSGIFETLQCTNGGGLWCDAATVASSAACGLCRRP
jgi:hypothetical protein